MTVSVWRIATDAPNYEADDLSGKGAELTGGRWNTPGTPVVYTASSIALACLETLVHLGSGSLPLNRYLVRIDIPDEVWNSAEIWPASTLRVGWDAIPEGRVSLEAGQKWLSARKTLLALAPSVIIPEEYNVLINPGHADMAKITGSKLRKWRYELHR